MATSPAASVQHFIYPLSSSSDYYFEGTGAINPENYWKDALAGATDEWGLSTGFRVIEPGDWVWAYFSGPVYQILGVGTVVGPIDWNAGWGRHSVHIWWDRKLTAALKRQPIGYAEYRQHVQRSAIRAKPETLAVLRAWLSSQGSTALDQAAAVKFAERTVNQRLGQPEFRAKVLDAYGGACAVTGCAERGTLQAAHIVAVGAGGKHAVENSLLLRADVHNLFDLGLLTITSRLQVRVADSVRDKEYRALDGRRIEVPSGAPRAKILKALAAHRTLHGR